MFSFTITYISEDDYDCATYIHSKENSAVAELVQSYNDIINHWAEDNGSDECEVTGSIDKNQHYAHITVKDGEDSTEIHLTIGCVYE